MSRIRASLERALHNAGPIAVFGMFLLLAVVVFLLLRVSALSGQIVSLQKSQAESATTGRGILKQVLALNQRIVDQTDPNSQASKDQQARIGVILAQLDEAQRVGRADQLKKIAQMFQQCPRLPCDPAVVNRILAQPVPIPTFGPATAPAPAPTPAPGKPASTAGASVGKSSSAPVAPKPCPGPIAIQATPLTLPLLPPAQIQVCVPP